MGSALTEPGVGRARTFVGLKKGAEPVLSENSIRAGFSFSGKIVASSAAAGSADIGALGSPSR